MNYNINVNQNYGSLEIKFQSMPPAEVISALKELKFRWNNVKKLWYGFTTEENLISAIETGSTKESKTPKAPKENEWLKMAKSILSDNGSTFDGYMGGYGWEGKGSHQHKDITEINKEVKKMAIALYPDIKISAKASRFSGGRDTRILVSLPGDCFNTLEEYQNICKQHLGCNTWLNIYDENDKYIGCELMELHYNDTELINNTLRVEYNQWLHNDGNTYCRSQQNALLNEKGSKIMADINSLVNFYNYEDSNSMVDYYNTNFYSFINFNKKEDR